ncbi:MAG: GAF domain-containing protein [Chloroflexi bacterium]|nr:GAF domain-containing protein [Chloroflexota bacterium]
MANDRTRALLELLYRVSREVATALDLRTVLQRVLYAAIDNVGGERGSIVVLDDSGRPLDATIVYGKRFHDHTTQQLRVTVERGLAGWVVRHRKAALVPDTSKDERWLRRPDDSVEKSGAKSAICVPLLAREKMVGVLTLVHSLPNAFGPEHLELMQAIADQAGIAVLNARLYTESQRQARVMTALAEGAVTINASLQFEDVLQRILNQTIQALQVETVALALVEHSSGDLVFRAATGQNAGNIIDRRVPIGEGIVGKVAREGRGMVIPVVRDEKRYTETDRFGGIKAQAVAVAPIQAQGKVIGVLEAINPASGSFDPDALLVMTGIGSLAGTTIQNAQLFEQLQVAHKRYRELFEDSIDPILITDWEGRILEANRMAVSLSGYDDKKFRSMSIDQIHEVNWGKIGLEFENLRTDETCNYESMLHRQDGKTVPVEVYVRRVQFEETDSLQWTLHDITERKELDTLRDDLTAMIYHDLRSPLANVVSSLDVLSGMLAGKDNQALESLLTIATNSTARIQRLVSSLLDINRLESGQPIVAQQSVSPAALVEDALKAVSTAAESRRQTLQSNLPADLPNVWVDEDMIRRVLINLLENATKFSPVDGKIGVGAKADGDWVSLWVQDNGPGISPEDQERVFDKFTRLKGKNKPAGLGVGLAFCRLAVEGHGGRIWVESQPEQGSRFCITLPVAKPGSQE